MTELLTGSGFFAIGLTVAAFCVGQACQKKWKKAIFNPILIGAALVMLILWLLDVPVAQYQADCAPLTYLLTPATICLAIGFYQQLQRLKRHLPAILVGVVGGTLSSLLSVWLMAKWFGFQDALTVSLLPKSVTSAIGVALSEQAGGIGALTTAVIIITGIFGNVCGPLLIKVFRLEDPVSQGVAFGTASHVVGTSRAAEISPLVGAVSSLSLTLAGLITVIVFSFLV
jgi:predicted murein hydrolase (TIGR00659 family)